MRPIFYDTETTGIKIGKDRVIEIAAYDSNNDKTFQTLINPNMLIPQESQAICHITDEMVKDAPTLEEMAQDFIDFCGDDSILIAHNNDKFDKPFLEAEFLRINLPFPKFTYFDTLKWARKYRNDLPRHSLQYLREVYNIDANQAHRALDDVIILYKVYLKMVDDIPIDIAHNLLYSKSLLTTMPFGKHQGKPLKD